MTGLDDSEDHVTLKQVSSCMQLQLELAGLGLSFTRPTQEVFYVNLSGILARATTSKVRHTLELEIRSIQARLPCLSYPNNELSSSVYRLLWAYCNSKLICASM